MSPRKKSGEAGSKSSQVEAKYSSETSVYFKLTPRCYMPKDVNLHNHCYGEKRKIVYNTVTGRGDA
jgi:hypothetical protein